MHVYKNKCISQYGDIIRVEVFATSKIKYEVMCRLNMYFIDIREALTYINSEWLQKQHYEFMLLITGNLIQC